MTNKNDDLSPITMPPSQKRPSLPLVAAFFALHIPTDPLSTFPEGMPKGLRLLCVAPSQPEAELVRQVLVDAGFDAEYVSSTAAGAFGILGSKTVCVVEADYEGALAFLHAYLNAPESERTTDNTEAESASPLPAGPDRPGPLVSAVDLFDILRERVPEGLKLLYVAPSLPESELVRQVLIDAGFHIEYVSSAGAGAFGVMGSNVVYVQEADYDAALAFLNEYLNPAEGEASAKATAGGDEPTDGTRM